jgi:hypothetical protein
MKHEKENTENNIDKDPKSTADRKDSTKKPKGGSKTWQLALNLLGQTKED